MIAKDAEHFAETIAQAIRVATAPLRARIEQLEKRCGRIEGKAMLSDAGVWEASRQYLPGETVTDQGSAWIAQLV